MDDYIGAVSVLKDSSDSKPSSEKNTSTISLVWVVTGVPNLTKVGVVRGVV